MANLANEVMSHLDDAHIQQIAQQLGVDPAEAESAIQQAMPLLLGGLARNASSDDGAGALHSALGDHAGNDIAGILGSVLGGGGSAGGMSGGMAILGHIFGARRDQAAQGLGQQSGLGSANAGQLLAILAPVVMGVLGNMSQRQGMSASGLGSVLGQEQQRIGQSGAGGLLGAVFDQDGDGRLGLGDLLKVGEGLLGGARGRV
ncbi:MAG TPA: DUF937 domain-containing protein [Rhodanobacteraceae bacterium]|nr:DUF937 domain-containing protein [Rhodanobacteraceae bacterium]